MYVVFISAQNTERSVSGSFRFGELNRDEIKPAGRHMTKTLEGADQQQQQPFILDSELMELFSSSMSL